MADWEAKQKRINKFATRMSIVLWLFMCAALSIGFPLWAGFGFRWLMAGIGAVFWICGTVWFLLSQDE